MNRKSIVIILLTIFIFVISATANNDPNNVITSKFSDTPGKENSLRFQGQAIGESQIGKGTGILISKKFLQKDNNVMDIELGLQMPPKPAKLDIVLAMDTSGSMVQNYYSNDSYNATYLKWASDSIDTILNKTPEARVSVVSWDDDDENIDCSTIFYDIKGNESLIKGILVSTPG